MFVLRLDIAYDGTEFAGWATQAGQRTVAGVHRRRVVDGVPRRRCVTRAAGRTDSGVHATGQVAHVDVPAEALSHAYPRTPRPAEPSSGRWSAGSAGCCPRMSGSARSPGPQPDSTPGSRRCAATTCTGCRPRRTVSSRSRPVRDRVAATARRAMRWPTRRGSCWDCTTSRRSAVTATAPPRSANCSGWTACATGDGIAVHVTADAFCWNMVRSLVGALLAVGEHRRDSGLVRGAAGRAATVQRFRRRAGARADPGRGGLPARRRARGAHAGDARPAHADDDLDACRRRRHEVGRLVDHAGADVGGREMVGPVVLPVLRVGRVADRIVTVAQLDGPLGVEPG